MGLWSCNSAACLPVTALSISFHRSLNRLFMLVQRAGSGSRSPRSVSPTPLSPQQQQAQFAPFRQALGLNSGAKPLVGYVRPQLRCKLDLAIVTQRVAV